MLYFWSLTLSRVLVFSGKDGRMKGKHWKVCNSESKVLYALNGWIIWCVSFLSLWQIPKTNHLEGGKIYFGSQFHRLLFMVWLALLFLGCGEAEPFLQLGPTLKFSSLPNNAIKSWIHQWSNPVHQVRSLRTQTLPKSPTSCTGATL
jgi:hypothetical protein